MDDKTIKDIDNLARKAYLKDLALYLAYYCKEGNQDAAEVVEYGINRAIAAEKTKEKSPVDKAPYKGDV